MITPITIRVSPRLFRKAIEALVASPLAIHRYSEIGVFGLESRKQLSLLKKAGIPYTILKEH